MLHKDIQGSLRVATETQVAQQVESQDQLPHPQGFYLSVGGSEKVLSFYCHSCKYDCKLFGSLENRSVTHCGRVERFKNSFLRRLLLPTQRVVTRQMDIAVV